MSDDENSEQAKIPKGRASRFASLGGMASKIAGNVIANGLSELAKGNRPKVKDLLLTPSNLLKVADQLAQMRGAAMKVGQMISMDAGDVLPKELSDILARLRSDAKSMPEQELIALLEREWGKDWRSQFIQFSLKPIAAASIGQVHKAITKDLQRLAIKIQYPGIRQSIDSDVDNVATLIRISGLLPSELDIKPLLKEAKLQLHDEADYVLEAKYLEQYAKVIEYEPAFDMPKVDHSYSSKNILAMTYLDGDPIDSFIDAPQKTRNFLAEKLFGLFFKELFEFQLIQTDPNFANYQYDQETGKIVLLDFGATREYTKGMANGYRKLMSAGYHKNNQLLEQAVLEIGLLNPTLPQNAKHLILEMCMDACEPLQVDEEYAFAESKLATRLREKGMSLGYEKSYAHTPPVNCIFLHRKLGGLFLLAIKLRAKVNVRALFEPYLA